MCPPPPTQIKAVRANTALGISPQDRCKQARSAVKLMAVFISEIGPCHAEVVSRWLSPRRPGLAPSSVHVAFVVDKIELGQFFLNYHLFLLVSIIPPWLFILVLGLCHLRDK
jgi:hypothetical protein